MGLLSDEERREAKRAQKALEALAEATGGETFFPRDVSEVERIATQVAHDIRNQYTIAYTPLNQAMDGSFRQIKVTVKAAGNPTVRARSGYYATPDQGVRPAKSAAGQIMLRTLWRLTRGYRLRPWRSPYLRWRIETYWGLHAGEITFAQFWGLMWRQRWEMLRYLRWAGRMDAGGRCQARRPASGLNHLRPGNRAKSVSVAPDAAHWDILRMKSSVSS